MSAESTSPPSVHISGDTLALDQAVRDQVLSEANKLQRRHPDETLGLRVRIMEEFDRLHGHRVRCEVVTTLRERRQVIIREAKKQAAEAIAEAFAATKRQLRRLRQRGANRPQLAVNDS
ncbi:MAG: HPF/RaiA family ribosome-associated protein [Chromatiaceae bacterium]|jgi:ribosome-associated translation inhibitor RaiA